jgi:hypothetical protein
MATLLALGINILRLFQVLLKWNTMLIKNTILKTHLLVSSSYQNS